MDDKMKAAFDAWIKEQPSWSPEHGWSSRSFDRVIEWTLDYLRSQPAAGEEIMVNTPYDVFTLPLQPSGLSSGPRFVVHVPALDQQPAARPPKPTECMNWCPDRQVCDHCQWPPGPDQQPAGRVHDLAARLVDELDGMGGESDGVPGLHLNGDVATWDELLPGGRFERLSSLDELRAAIAAQPAESAEHATCNLQLATQEPVACAFFTEKGEVAYTGIYDRTLKALERVKTTRMGISAGSIDLYAAPVAALAPAADADALLDALRQIAEWPDGGNRYGQRNIKRFAQDVIDAIGHCPNCEASEPFDDSQKADSEFKGTPGPWIVSDGVTHITVRGGNGEVIFHDDKRIDRVREDARLIASAPVLLEALQAAIASFDEWAEDADPSSLADAKERLAWVDQARSAISLALGE